MFSEYCFRAMDGKVPPFDYIGKSGRSDVANMGEHQ